MQIRAASDQDFDVMTAITNHYIATTAIHFAYEPISRGELLETWQAYRDRHPWLVVEEAGAVVGYAKSGVWRDRAAYAWTCEVGLYVADRARGRGIGTTLYTALLDACAARGFRSAVAGITLPNPASIRLHERLGFAPVGVFQNAGWKHGIWHDVGFYQRRFATDERGPP